MNRNSYKKLNVYQDAKTLVVDIYKLINHYPAEERYALCNQMRRAASLHTLAYTPYTIHHTLLK